MAVLPFSSENINHRLVYDIAPYCDEIRDANQRVVTANKQVEEAETAFRKAVSKQSQIPEDQLRFTTEHCRARGIRYHVFHKKNPKRVGNKCIFCNASDIPDL